MISAAFFLGKIVPQKPVAITTSKSGNDFLFFKSVSIICISNTAINCFIKHGISGWATYPVILRDKQKRIISGYHGLSITGRVGGFDMNSSYLSKVVPFALGLPSNTVRKGLKLDLSQWDGSDICAIEGKRYIFLNKKAYLAISACKLTGIPLTPINEFEVLEIVFNP